MGVSRAWGQGHERDWGPKTKIQEWKIKREAKDGSASTGDWKLLRVQYREANSTLHRLEKAATELFSDPPKARAPNSLRAETSGSTKSVLPQL